MFVCVCIHIWYTHICTCPHTHTHTHTHTCSGVGLPVATRAVCGRLVRELGLWKHRRRHGPCAALVPCRCWRHGTHTHTHTRTYTHTHTHTRTYTHTHTPHTHTQKRAHTHTSTHKHTQGFGIRWTGFLRSQGPRMYALRIALGGARSVTDEPSSMAAGGERVKLWVDNSLIIDQVSKCVCVCVRARVRV